MFHRITRAPKVHFPVQLCMFHRITLASKVHFPVQLCMFHHITRAPKVHSPVQLCIFHRKLYAEDYTHSRKKQRIDIDSQMYFN